MHISRMVPVTKKKKKYTRTLGTRLFHGPVVQLQRTARFAFIRCTDYPLLLHVLTQQATGPLI